MKDPNLPHDYPDGIDRILINLLPTIKTPEELDTLINHVRSQFV